MSEELKLTPGQTLAFFASVIKSGEPWTGTCQKAYDEAMAALSSPRVEEVRREERERVAKALARANNQLPGIEVPAAGGDNLAVVLCSFFCDGEPSEDDHGWSPAAIEGEEQMIEAIRKHYEDALFPPVG